MRSGGYRDHLPARTKGGLGIEAASLLVVFASSFLSGQAAAGATGSAWWGIVAGVLVFIGIIFSLVLIVKRLVPPAPGQVASGLAASELAGLLCLFLVADLAGILVTDWTGGPWWGLLSGTIVMALLFLLLLRLAEWIAERPMMTADSPLQSAAEELRWAEPRGFRREELGEASRWILGMILFTLASTLFFLWIAGRYSPGTDAPKKLLIAAGGITAVFLSLLGLTHLVSIVVRITGEGIVREMGGETQRFSFAEIEHCEIGRTIAGDGSYEVLVAHLTNGDREEFCLDPSVGPELVRASLERAGVKTAMRAMLPGSPDRGEPPVA